MILLVYRQLRLQGLRTLFTIEALAAVVNFDSAGLVLSGFERGGFVTLRFARSL